MYVYVSVGTYPNEALLTTSTDAPPPFVNVTLTLYSASAFPLPVPVAFIHRRPTIQPPGPIVRVLGVHANMPGEGMAESYSGVISPLEPPPPLLLRC